MQQRAERRGTERRGRKPDFEISQADAERAAVKLKEWRNRQRLNQSMAAAILRCSRPEISRVETGRGIGVASRIIHCILSDVDVNQPMLLGEAASPDAADFTAADYEYAALASRFYRANLALRQGELAALFGCTVGEISRLENGMGARVPSRVISAVLALPANLVNHDHITEILRRRHAAIVSSPPILPAHDDTEDVI